MLDQKNKLDRYDEKKLKSNLIDKINLLLRQENKKVYKKLIYYIKCLMFTKKNDIKTKYEIQK